MIVQGIISLVVTVVSFFQGLLPSVSVPSWFTTDQLGGSLASSLGSLMAPVNHVLPLDALLTVLSEAMALLPVIVAYMVFQWAWDHVPTIAGFGTQ